MKKTNRILLSALLITIASSSAGVFAGTAADSAAHFQLKEYPYTISNHLATLERYQKSVERNLNTSRWKEIPENLLMVYLWNKENFHDDSLAGFADKWIELGKLAKVRHGIEEAELAVIFANLIKQNYAQAALELSGMGYKPGNEFLESVARTLIGETEQATATLRGNQNLTFTYNVRVSNINDAEKLAEAYPQSASARYILGVIQEDRANKDASQGAETEEGAEPGNANYDEAISQINRAIELDPYNLLYRLKKIELSYRQNPETSDESFRNTLRESLNDSYVAERIGNFYARNRDIDKSIDYLNIAIANDKDRKNLYKKIHSLYAYRGEVAPLISLYEQAIAENPLEPDYYYELAELYQGTNDYNKMEDIFQRAIEKNPGNSELHVALGDVYFNQKKEEQAIEEYLKGIELNKNNTDAYSKLISVYWDKGDDENVLKYSEEVIKNNPRFSMGYLWLGSVYLKQERPDDAVKQIRKAINVNPKFIAAYNSLGIAYRAAEKYEQAIEQFQKALALNPNYEDALINMGDTYFKMKNYTEAEKVYESGLKNDPYNADLYFALGNLHTETGNFQKSEQAFQRSILLNPDFLDARNNLGNAYLKQNNLDQAINEFNKIVALKPDYATAYYNLACAYSLKNQIQVALDYLEKAVTLDPSLKEIAQNDPDFNNVKDSEKFSKLVS